MPAPISKADLVTALESLADTLGRPPTRAEMETDGAYSATPYYRQFGSWPAALKAADLDPQHRQQIPDSKLLTALRELATDLGCSPRPKDMAEQGPFSPSTYRRRFGSWAAALEEAGLSQNTISSRTRIERTDLLSALYQLSNDLGRPPAQSEMEDCGPFSPDVYHNRFGSWRAALAEAGLKLDERD